MRFGHGPKFAFCFHGYGEDAGSFQFLEKYAGAQYSFFALDLPFHGLTDWKDGYNCTSDDIRKIIFEIVAQNTPHVEEVRLTLIGFSLGGRVALALYEKIPSRVERLVLLASDGLKVNFWYWLATQNWAGNKLFAFTMKHPGW